MLKSTYTPSARLAVNPLPPEWSEHKAPTGHTYYYNAQTKESTYHRPGGLTGVELPEPSLPQLKLSDPNVANAFMARHQAANLRPSQESRGGGGAFARDQRGSSNRMSGPELRDRPLSKFPIPGSEPWFLVFTKYGRRFAYNSVKNESFWRIPDKLKAGILQLDQERILNKAASEQSPAQIDGPGKRSAEGVGDQKGKDRDPAAHDFDSSEYEEVEVTDDEELGGAEQDSEEDDEEEDGAEPQSKRPKRQRTETTLQGTDEQAVEFDEADIAYQLRAMGDEYGLAPGEYDDGNMEDWPEGAEGLTLSDEDAHALFKDLLNDFHINPYSPWEKLIEEGKIIHDSRYTVLHTMKARKETWEDWSRDKIRDLKAARAKQEKTDPRIPYMVFLQERANPKLYWPEFKRKHRKESVMKDGGLPDKDREKWYREHINRLKLPQATLVSDLTAMLKALPLSQLNNQTVPGHLPSQVLTDIRYISLDPQIRDALVEAYIQNLGPPPSQDQIALEKESEAALKEREERRRRERALEERERAALEERRRLERKMQTGRAALREEERELEMAMQVGKRGLQSQLAADVAQAKDA